MHVLHHKCDNIYSPIFNQPVCTDFTTVLQMMARKEPVSKFMHPFYVITPVFRNILKCGLKSISFGFTLWIMHDDWLVYFCSISNVLIDRRLMSTIKLYSHSVNETRYDPFFHLRAGTTFFFHFSSKNYYVYKVNMILGRRNQMFETVRRENWHWFNCMGGILHKCTYAFR